MYKVQSSPDQNLSNKDIVACPFLYRIGLHCPFLSAGLAAFRYLMVAPMEAKTALLGSTVAGVGLNITQARGFRMFSCLLLDQWIESYVFIICWVYQHDHPHSTSEVSEWFRKWLGTHLATGQVLAVKELGALMSLSWTVKMLCIKGGMDVHCSTGPWKNDCEDIHVPDELWVKIVISSDE